jgi:hypothetical protein
LPGSRDIFLIFWIPQGVERCAAAAARFHRAEMRGLRGVLCLCSGSSVAEVVREPEVRRFRVIGHVFF